MPVTFVTAFINLQGSDEKTPESRFQLFSKLADTGIRIHLFLSRSYTHYVPPSNVSVEYIDLEELDIYNEIKDIQYVLPSIRNLHKDTSNYMILMNSKIEFMYRAMRSIESTHYAWIDFSIFHILKDVGTPAYLKMLGNANLRDGLYIAGCWNRFEPSFSAVNWRFCGGFFVGDKSSIEEFYRVYKMYFRDTVARKGLAWEVNMWAWFEYADKLQCKWFQADHNDSIVRLPESALLLGLTKEA